MPLISDKIKIIPFSDLRLFLKNIGEKEYKK